MKKILLLLFLYFSFGNVYGSEITNTIIFPEIGSGDFSTGSGSFGDTDFGFTGSTSSGFGDFNTGGGDFGGGGGFSNSGNTLPIFTIHSTDNGGNWNSISTWVEGRIPTTDDIVKINGNVTVVGNTTIDGIHISNSGGLYNGFTNASFNINGNLLNNGVIKLSSSRRDYSVIHGWYTDYFNTKLNISGDIENNGDLLSTVNTFGSGNVNIKGDLSGYINYNNLGSLYADGKIGGLILQKDITMKGNFDVGTVNLNGKILDIQNTSTNKIENLIGLGSITNTTEDIFEINIDSLSTNIGTKINIDTIYTTKISGNFTGNHVKITNGGKLDRGNINVSELNINGNVITTGFHINGNIIVNGSGSLINDYVNSNFSINGNLLNNGVIKLSSSRRDYSVINGWYTDYFNTKLNISGDILNNGSITSTSVYLSWNQIEGYNDYILDISGREYIEINNSTKYLIDNSILNNELNILWKVKGDGIITDSVWTLFKCINHVRCNNLGTDYSNPVENNSNDEASVENKNSSNDIQKTSPADVSIKENDTGGANKLSDTGNEGDPVNLNTGEFVYDNTLMQYSGIGLPFEFKIHYENQAYYNGIIGNNFDFNYNLFLVEGTDGTMNFHNGKLGVFPFEQTASGFTDNLTIDSSLKLVDNKYVLSMNNNIFYTFGENLRVESITDIHGNALSFTYNENKQLLTVTDTLDRVFNFDYYDHSRLQTITDFTGNTVDFSYFGTGGVEGMQYDLDKITTTNSGKTRDISFTYTTSDEFVDAHNIVKLIDSENNIYVENTYDTNDMVSSQKYGDASILYTYTLSGSGKIVENNVIDRSENNTIYTYDDFGNTLKKVNKKSSGDSIYEYEYNSDNKLSKEILPLGNGYTYSYDERLNLIERRMKTDVHAVDSDEDLVTSYEYHPVFNIKTKVTQANGLVTDITLNDKGNVIGTQTTGVVDFDNNSLNVMNSFEYNNVGQLIKKTDAKGNITQFEYLNGNLVKTIKVGTTENIETNFSYDVKNNITSITDGEGNITHLTYDEFNLLQSQTTPEGIVSQYEYNSLNKKINESIILSDNSSVTTTYEYDILDNPTVITKDRESNKTDTVVTKYDLDSRIIETKSADNAVNTFEYNPSGQIIKKVTKASIGDIVTGYTYDVNNRLLTQTNPNNSIITFEYDLFDRVEKQTDTEGTYSEFTYDKSGNILTQKVSDVNNVLLQKQESTFDKLNRNIITNIHNLDKNEVITSKSKYDTVGNMIQSVDPKGNVVNYEYDEFNRAIKITDSLGNITESIYNRNNKVTSTTITSAEGKVITTSYIYDSDNRVTSETNTLGETVSYTYNNLNQVVLKTDKDLGVTNYSYDYSGNILSESHEDKTITYTYDTNSNLQTVTDANNNVTTYSYNNISLLESITYPDGNIMRYSYDTSGNMIEKSDPNGSVIKSTYDELNRLVSKTITTGSGVLGVTSENYTYDALSRLISATDSEGNDLEFDFDSLGRLTSETNSNKVIGYDYDLVGNRTQITNPNNSIINYSYDINNRLTQISSEGNAIADYTYDSLSLLSKTLGNNLTTNYGYDELLRLKSLNNYSYTYNTQGNITSNGTDNYSYDSLDRVTDVNYQTKHNKKSAENFEYDLMGNRNMETLAKLTKNGTERQKKFSYDINNLNQYLDRSIYVDIDEIEDEVATGSIVDTTATGSIEVTSTEIITEEEFITEEPEETEVIEAELEVELEGKLIYDNNGNLIGNLLNNKRQYVYSYDYKNRLVQIEKNLDTTLPNPLFTSEGTEPEFITKQKIVQIKYDVLGRRIEKKFNNNSYRKYYYSNQDIILEENYSKKDKLKNSKEFIYSNSLDDVLSMKLVEYKTRKIKEEYVNKKGVTKTRKIKEQYVETNNYFYQKDHLGSIIAITDETGTIVEEYSYDIFGKPYTKKSDGTITRLKKSPIGNTRMYTGREYDRGLKLYYNRARYYNPKLGRFISRDPIDIADDVNLYAYVGNNSVMFVDLRGTEKYVLNVLYRPTISGGHLSIELEGYVYTYVASSDNRYTVGVLSAFIPSTVDMAVDADVEKIESDDYYDYYDKNNNLTIHSYNIDKLKKEKIQKYIDDTIENGNMKYNLLGTNCSTFVQKVLYIGGLEDGINDSNVFNGIPSIYNKTLIRN